MHPPWGMAKIKHHHVAACQLAVLESSHIASDAVAVDELLVLLVLGVDLLGLAVQNGEASHQEVPIDEFFALQRFPVWLAPG